MNAVQEVRNMLSKEELSILAGVSVPTVDKWIQKGRVTPHRIKGRVFFDRNIEIPKRRAIRKEVIDHG